MGCEDSEVWHRALGTRVGDWRLPGAEHCLGGSGTRCLCHEAQELVGGECEHTEHAVAHHLGGAADSDMATAELVLETAVDALTRRTFVIANVLGKRKADGCGSSS